MDHSHYLHVNVHVSWESARDTLTAKWNGNGFRSPGKTIFSCNREKLQTRVFRHEHFCAKYRYVGVFSNAVFNHFPLEDFSPTNRNRLVCAPGAHFCQKLKIDKLPELLQSLMTAFPGYLTSTQSARKLAAKLVLYVVRTGNWPPRQEGNSSSQWFSQIWSMLLQQPSRSCRLINKIDFWRSGERPFDAWQVFIPKTMSYHWSEI